MNKKLIQFIDSYISSFVVWDLIVFYHQNPGVIATLPELVSCLGRKIEDVAQGVEELKNKGVIKPAAQSSYIFDPAPELREDIDHFVRLLEDRNVRLQILTSLLKKGVA